MRRYWLWKGLKFAVAALLLLGAIGLLVMGLWNWLAPEVFGGHAIGFWQALGLFALARLLVGGLRGRGHHGHWRARMAERWDRMTPEERERLRAGLHGRCGRRGRGEPAATAASS